MSGTVITVSSRVPLAELERRVRERVARDGVAPLVAVSGRQRTHLRRLADRLGADPGLRVSFVQRTDGVIQLAAMPAGQRYAGWFGDVMGVPED